MDTSALSYWQQLDLLVSQWKEQQRRPVQGEMKLTKATLPRSPIQPIEWSIANKMQCQVTFPVGSAHKRFVRGLSEKSQLSDRGRAYLAYLAHRYRRQWQGTTEELEWLVRWGEWVKP